MQTVTTRRASIGYFLDWYKIHPTPDHQVNIDVNAPKIVEDVKQESKEIANHLQETGLDKLKAVVEAATTRLRPILMTTAATVVGHMPLVFAHGPGAGARNSIGIMLVTGMAIGTVFTLFILPAVYMLFAAQHKPEAAPVEPPHTAGLQPAE